MQNNRKLRYRSVVMLLGHTQCCCSGGHQMLIKVGTPILVGKPILVGNVKYY